MPICTQGVQRTWWPEAGTIIVTGLYWPLYNKPVLCFKKIDHVIVRLNSVHWNRNDIYDFDKIFITGCTGSCENDNFWCSQWGTNFDIMIPPYFNGTGFGANCPWYQWTPLYMVYLRKPPCMLLHLPAWWWTSVPISCIPWKNGVETDWKCYE